MNEPPTGEPFWQSSAALLRTVPIATPLADLLEDAEQRWRGRVVPRTSMADLFFTLPHHIPWRAKVNVSVRHEGFEFQLFEEDAVISHLRGQQDEAPRVLDAFLTRLIAS
jgi:hypothetical protein